MTVYVLACNYVNVDSGEESNEIIGVYDTCEKAMDRMVKEIPEIRKDFEHVDTEENDYVNGDMCWEIWEKGEYFSNHCNLTIYEKEII